MEIIKRSINIGHAIGLCRVIKKDSSEIWLESVGKFLNDELQQGEILLISRDVTERKQVEEALRQSEEKYRLIVDNAYDMIVKINLDDYRYLYVNPSTLKVSGYSELELLGRDCTELVHKDDLPMLLEIYNEMLQTGKSEGRAQFRCQQKDGNYIWLEVTGKIISGNAGQHEMLLFNRDINERKQAEEELRKNKQELQDKVNYLNTLIDTMNELCYTVDQDYRISFANQKAIESTGFSLGEGLGRSILDFLPENDQEEVLRQVRNRLVIGDPGSYEQIIICKDGREILIKAKSSPIIENGKITGSLVLAEDITQQRIIEKEMARFGQMNTVGEMAASIGHEIRNPMTTVQGFLQIMSQNEQLSDQRPYFDLMLEELNRANSIITEFLSLAKDKMVNLQSHNLNEIVETLAPLLAADAIKGDKYVSFMLGNIDDVLVDEKEIRQLILNLVRNGLEAMSAGKIIIKTYQEEEHVILSVQDEGEGIAPEIQERLGTPFLTSKGKWNRAWIGSML